MQCCENISFFIIIISFLCIIIVKFLLLYFLQSEGCQTGETEHSCEMHYWSSMQLFAGLIFGLACSLLMSFKSPLYRFSMRVGLTGYFIFCFLFLSQEWIMHDIIALQQQVHTVLLNTGHSGSGLETLFY